MPIPVFVRTAVRHTSDASSGERGQAAAEFAICLPILCMLLLAVIQFGQMTWQDMELTSAARDGARRAAVARDEPDPVASVRAVVSGSLDRVQEADVTTTVTGGWTRGDQVTVRVTKPHSIDIMGVEVWSGNLRAESTVRIG